MLMFTADFPLTCRKLRLTTLNRIKGIPKNDNSGWLEMTMGNNSWQNWTTERKGSLLLTKKIFWLTNTVKKNPGLQYMTENVFKTLLTLINITHLNQLKAVIFHHDFTLFSVFLSCILQKNLQQIGKSLMCIYFKIHFFRNILIAIKKFPPVFTSNFL